MHHGFTPCSCHPFCMLRPCPCPQMYELRTPLLRTPQPGITVLGAALAAGLDDGTNAAGTGMHMHGDAGATCLPCIWQTAKHMLLLAAKACAAGLQSQERRSS
jgi:hypothetical protein